MKRILYLSVFLSSITFANPEKELIVYFNKAPNFLFGDIIRNLKGSVDVLNLDFWKVSFQDKSVTSKALNELRSLGYVVGRNQLLYPLSNVDRNPPIQTPTKSIDSPDPLMNQSWERSRIQMLDAWKTLNEEKNKKTQSVVVAVIDTGVYYNHEDLSENIWRNLKEIPGNNLDDDNNGFVDDVVGWDFADNDAFPDDVTQDTIFKDGKLVPGNMGHGTHCAGNVGARGNNGLGLAGVAPFAKIMALRFITEFGSGTTADAIKAVLYAADNGAKIISASWGAEGTGDDPENIALASAIDKIEKQGVLFVVAAGNSGYDMNSTQKKIYPAATVLPNVLTVAASDLDDELASFSNSGNKYVHIAAPGHVIMSTVPFTEETKGLYASKFYPKAYNGYAAPISGTSMATPLVAGAAALVWAYKPEWTYKQVREHLLNNSRKISKLGTAVSSSGILDVHQAARNL